MAKVKVTDIAKKLGVPSKEVKDYLAAEKIAVDDDGMVEGDEKTLIDNYKKSKAAAPKLKKKASISAVYNPKYSIAGAERRPGPRGKDGRVVNSAKVKKAPVPGKRPVAASNGEPVKRRPVAAKPAPAVKPAAVPAPEAEKKQNVETAETQAVKKEAAPVEKVQTPAPESTKKTVKKSKPVSSIKITGNIFDNAYGNRSTAAAAHTAAGRPARTGGTKNEAGVQGSGRNNKGAGAGRANRAGGSNRASDSGRGFGSEKQARGQSAGQGRGVKSASSGNGRGKKSRDYDKKNRKQEQIVNLEKQTGHKKHNVQHAPARNMDEILTITLPEYITIKDLSDKMMVKASDVIKKLFLAGQMLTLTQEVDYAKAEEIALEFNCICEPEEKIDLVEELLKEEEEDESLLKPRPPVVCVMGHVDHGKTSLLDKIRSTHVTEREAGGITQHIGASVATINGRKITFLDTPGHEAFTAMRMRGANSTDIAVLVVAADDGIMPQTIEAINHAKAAGVELVVAINKIDKSGANIDKVKQELSEHDLIPEDWGGSTICVPVSAKTGEGIPELLEMILLTADVLELKANPDRKARGIIIEAKLDKGRGSVATVLVQKGTLSVGDCVAAGSSYGKIRAMFDHNGKGVKKAGPSTPVEIIGLNSVPGAGEVLIACDSEKDARSAAETFVSRDKEKLLEETRARMSLDDIFSKIQEGKLKELDLIVKADVQGSVEALKSSLTKLSNDEVVVKVIHSGVGAITESDVTLASASEAVIIGFNVKPDATAKSTAEQQKVDIRTYNVIYNAIDDVEKAMKGMLEPIYEEQITGHAEIRQIFKASGVGNIAGSYVLDGVIGRNDSVRVMRGDEQIFEGKIESLKRFKDDAKEVKAGFECGIVIDGFSDIAEGDQLETYKMVEVPRQ